MNIFAKLGLIKLSEHDKVAKANKGLLRDLIAERAKLKQAVSDIAYQSDTIGDLRHDAQKWRDKLARDRAARKGVGK